MFREPHVIAGMGGFGASLAPFQFFSVAKWGEASDSSLIEGAMRMVLGFYNLRLISRGTSASSASHPSIGKEDEKGCIFKGETCQKSGGFHQLEWCAQEEMEGA